MRMHDEHMDDISLHTYTYTYAGAVVVLIMWGSLRLAPTNKLDQIKRVNAEMAYISDDNNSNLSL